MSTWGIREAILGALCLLAGLTSAAQAATYYVDFDGGADAADGRSTGTAWKHCPGDTAATGVPAGKSLAAGDKVIFKGGVHYRGVININWSGAANNPITYDGNTAGTFGAGQGVIDGAENLTGWTQCAGAGEVDGHANWANIYWTYAPAGITAVTANLHENDQMLWLAEQPNMSDPFDWDNNYEYLYYDAADSTSVTDNDYFTQSDPNYWNGTTYVSLLTGSARVILKKVTGYNAASHKILHAVLASNGSESPPYPPGVNGRYAMVNTFKVMDQPGECVVREDQVGPGGGPKVYVWPRTGGVAGKTFTISVRPHGLYAFNKGYITIQGLKLIKFVGGDSGGGGAIVDNGTGLHDVTVKNCAL